MVSVPDSLFRDKRVHQGTKEEHGVTDDLFLLWQGQKDLNLLHKPPCGSRNGCRRAVSAAAATHPPLFPPLAALRCVARHAPRAFGIKSFTHTKSKKSRKRDSFAFGRGRRKNAPCFKALLQRLVMRQKTCIQAVFSFSCRFLIQPYISAFSAFRVRNVQGFIPD